MLPIHTRRRHSRRLQAKDIRQPSSRAYASPAGIGRDDGHSFPIPYVIRLELDRAVVHCLNPDFDVCPVLPGRSATR
jgi:hypothetical protein